MSFYFRRIHFLSCDVDHVRDPAHDPESGAVTREQIVRNKGSAAKFLFVRPGKVTVGRDAPRKVHKVLPTGGGGGGAHHTPRPAPPPAMACGCGVVVKE